MKIASGITTSRLPTSFATLLPTSFEKIKTMAFNYLSEIKETHSKVHKIEYSELKLQPILVSKHSEITIKEKQFDESARTRMLDLKKNFKVRAADTKCRGCETEEENTGKPSLPGSERHQSSQRGASLQ